ncbi:MAG: DUF5671 domain-containing protein [Paracoccaceae bacterium]|jgi:hypothetical protein
MRPSDELAHFVREALASGQSRTDIGDALTSAGWSEKERLDALDAFADTAFTPPVPRPRPYVSAKDAFLYGLLFVTLGVSAFSLNNLLFSLIQLSVSGSKPVVTSIEYNTIRWSISTLIFSIPLFSWLSWLTARAIGNDAGKRRSAIRKTLTYLTLFIAALFVLGDLVTLVFYLLNGETTLRFFLKFLSVGAITGGIFVYYLKDVAADEN